MTRYIKYNTGDQLWIDDKGQPLFCVDDGGKQYDFRVKAPFLQLLPCPYCGVERDFNHDPSKHVYYQSYDVEILDEWSNECHYYRFDRL